MHNREAEAGIDAPTIDDDRAGAALTVIAAFFRSSEMEMLSQSIEQRGPRIELQLPADTVDVEADLEIATPGGAANSAPTAGTQLDAATATPLMRTERLDSSRSCARSMKGRPFVFVVLR